MVLLNVSTFIVKAAVKERHFGSFKKNLFNGKSLPSYILKQQKA
jgi:hypothetical protein